MINHVIDYKDNNNTVTRKSGQRRLYLKIKQALAGYETKHYPRQSY